MPRLKLRRILSLALSLAILGIAPSTFASAVPPDTTAPAKAAIDPHHLDGTRLGAPLDITSTWLMQPGDDPHYADPSFDDSHWTVVKSGKKASIYGFKDVNQVWYRLHLQIPPSQPDLSLLVRSFGGSFQAFVNGVEVGSSGPHPEGGNIDANFDRRFAIPASLVASGDVVIAFHGHIGRFSEAGFREGGITSFTKIFFGPTPVLVDTTSLYLFRSYTSNTANILMELLVPLIALALALTLPKEREYAALVIAGAASAAADIFSIWRTTTLAPANDFWFITNGLLSAVSVVASLEFVRLVLGLRRSRWWAWYEWTLAVLLLGPVPWVNHVIVYGNAGLRGSFILVVSLIAQIFTLPFAVGLPLLALWVWWRRRSPDALLLFVPLFLSAVVQYCQFALYVLNRFHITELANLPKVPIDTFFVQWSEVANFLFNLALLMFLVLRTVRIARSRAAMATDLHAVHSVQEILLARASHPTPGFRVEHVYHPASEVGGDFFLVSPGPDGSLTAVLGDVSGKGLVAAMRVSMILGVLRREENRDPDAILRNLNEALLMQGEMGFTTACCVRVSRDGHYTVANAGHISPYINGQEIIAPPSLPLGMQPDQEYEQVSGVLKKGQTLVLMSDGVVEARSAKGELYGFDRLAALTMLSADDIADVARRFGQEDDITVLTVACG
jgi:sigma-B regulation protein RsbU (phosphoserine phosphatase)